MSDLALLTFVSYLALHERPGGLNFFCFFGGLIFMKPNVVLLGFIIGHHQRMGCTILYNGRMIEALIEAIGLFFTEFFERRKKKKEAKKKS